MPKQTVSLCMITKNEESNLASCLNSVKELVDEIIIADTGSTDKTKEIAKKFKAKIYDFKWSGDFSAARNESLKHATREWILVLDADEELEGDSVKAIKEFVAKKEADAFLLIQKNYTNDSSIAGFVNEPHEKNGKKYSGWYGSLIARLFRNLRGYEFSGIVHELAEPSIEKKKGKIAATNLFIHHYGNADPEASKKKKKFYLELCEKKARQKPDAASCYELGVLYKENEMMEDAVKALKKAAELEPKHSRALFELGVVYEKQKNYNEAINSYTESLRIRNSNDAFKNLGICYSKIGDGKKAYANLTKAILISPNDYTIYNSLGSVLEKNGDFDTAAQMLELAIGLNPNNTIGYYNLGIVLDKKRDYANAMKNYEKAAELGHRNKEEIKKRIKELKGYIEHNPKYGFDFKIG